MNNIKRCVLFALLLLVAMPFASAQTDEPVTTINGKQYYVHKVKKGETFWGLSKTYNVSVEELMELNPEAASGLKADAVINIPVTKNQSVSVTPVAPKPTVTEPQTVVVEPKPTIESPTVSEPKPTVTVKTDETTLDGKIRHEVQKGETIYGISRQYGITEQELIGMNPGIESGLRAGQVLVIPSNGEINIKPATTTVQVTEQPKTENPVSVSVSANTTPVKKDDKYKVKKGENLYDIARKFGVDIVDLKAANQGLTNYPIEGLPIIIPERKNNDNFFVHRVEQGEKTANFVKKWNMTVEEFTAINSTVGRRVYADQAVLIPMTDHDYDTDHDTDNDQNQNTDKDNDTDQNSGNTETVKPTVTPVTSHDTVPEQSVDTVETVQPSVTVVSVRTPCKPVEGAAYETYRVALLMPLYLEEVSGINIRKDNTESAKKARPFKFLHFYEGFMIALDELKKEGLNLDLQIIDVDEDVNKAQKAVTQLRNNPVDVIIGPFFSRSFSIVSEYALQNNIMLVNPLSERQNILENNANVVKVQPSDNSQIDALCALLTEKYPDALCTVFAPLGKEEDSTVTAIANAIKTRVKNDTAEVIILPCNNASFKTLETMSSSKRNTVVVAIGDQLVFATQMLNSLNKTVNKTPVTLIALPEWSEFDNLLVDNLMRMNAIYFSDYFVDYTDESVNDFVEGFRSLYKFDPNKYAFMGYDVANYFLNALMQYGSKPCDCLQDYSPKLMHTKFDFSRKSTNNGLENTFWNIYQYDNENTTLKLLNR